MQLSMTTRFVTSLALVTLVGLGLGAAPASAQLRGTLTGDFEPTVILLETHSNEVRRCSGTPNLIFEYSAPSRSLTVFFERHSGDPTLAVRDPVGRCHYNDNVGGAPNSLILMDQPIAGEYHVFVGRYSGLGIPVSGNIGITEDPHQRPQPTSRAPTGFPSSAMIAIRTLREDRHVRDALQQAVVWAHHHQSSKHVWIHNRDEFSERTAWRTDGFFGSVNARWTRLYEGALRTFGQRTYPAGTTFGEAEDEDANQVAWNDVNWAAGFGLSAGYVRRFLGMSTDWYFGFGRVKQQTGPLSLRLQPARQRDPQGVAFPEFRIGAGYTRWSFDGTTRASTSTFATPTVDMGIGVRFLILDFLMGVQAHVLFDQQLGPDQTGGVAWQLNLGVGLSADPTHYLDVDRCLRGCR